MRGIAGGLVKAQTMLLEPAMQHIGIHAMFTRRGGNRCAGLLARGDQFNLELRAVDPARAGDTGARMGDLLRHGVHDGLRGHDLAQRDVPHQDGITGRIQPKDGKARYKTTNWAEYNAALKARGSLTIWLGFVAQSQSAELVASRHE